MGLHCRAMRENLGRFCRQFTERWSFEKRTVARTGSSGPAAIKPRGNLLGYFLG
jgi:hypothetical protein